jgi:hypothetical protein
MKKGAILVTLLAISLQTAGQEYRKYWADGALTWNDFQAKPTKNNASYLAYILMYQTDKKTIDNVLYQGIFSDAYVDTSLSFIHPNLKDAYQLKYHQVIFNLVELYKRRLQTRIYSLNTVFEINSIFSDIKNQLDRKILDFQEAGNYGIQKNVTDRWLSETKETLRIKSSFEIPNFKQSNWTYGLYGGLDFGFYGGKYKETFNNTIAAALGFEFSYRKVFMDMHMNFTNSKLNRDLIDNSLTLMKGERTTIGMLSLSFGYPIYETQKIRILPFAGYGVTFLSEAGQKENKTEISTGTSIFGLNFDFKNKKTVNFTPTIFDLREAGNSYIRTRIFMTNANFNPTLKGYSLNVGIAYGIEGRFLSKK